MEKLNINTKQKITYFGSNKIVVIPNKMLNIPRKAMWVSNVMNIDLPVITDDGKKYIKELEKLIAFSEENNIKRLYFQVRTTNDAFYQSKLNPWSRFASSKEGEKPTVDPLSMIIKLAHEKNIEIHAWLNPYRVSKDGSKSIDEYLMTCDDLNFAKRNKELIVLDKNGKLILNPASSRVKKHVLDTILEIVDNYDVDGIHFDDYFYPYAGLDEKYNDLSTYEIYHFPNENIDDFRRRQVNELVFSVHKVLKRDYPNVLFGISPFGIWKNKKENEFGSNTSPKCMESYYAQYADSVLWVKKGWIDYIVPQLYFSFGHEIAPFADLVDFWVEVVNNTGVELCIGHGVYRLGSDGDWLDDNELKDQVLYTSKYPDIKENAFFTYSSFVKETKTQNGIKQWKKLNY